MATIRKEVLQRISPGETDMCVLGMPFHAITAHCLGPNTHINFNQIMGPTGGCIVDRIWPAKSIMKYTFCIFLYLHLTDFLL